MWQGHVLRRRQLEDLLQQGLVMSERMAAKAAFRVWHEVSGAARPPPTWQRRHGVWHKQ
jgi:hypothetical protein